MDETYIKNPALNEDPILDSAASVKANLKWLLLCPT